MKLVGLACPDELMDKVVVRVLNATLGSSSTLQDCESIAKEGC